MDDLPCSVLLEVCLHLSFRIQTHAVLLQKLILFCAFPLSLSLFSFLLIFVLAICFVNKRNTFHSLTRGGHLVKGEILVPCSKACVISRSLVLSYSFKVSSNVNTINNTREERKKEKEEEAESESMCVCVSE